MTALSVPAIASASFILDTGTPTGSGGPVVISKSSTEAAEFYVAAGGETITSLAAYLTKGTAAQSEPFQFQIFSNSGFISTRAPTGAVLTTTATYNYQATGGAWNSVSVHWTPTTAGYYWLVLEQPNTGYQLDAPQETGAQTGTVPATAFAFAGTAGYSETGALPIGLEVTAVPLPGAMWLLFGGIAGLGVAARTRNSMSAATA